MAEFSYSARNQAGKTVRGKLQAASEERAVALLQANNLTPIRVTVGGADSLLNRTVFGGKVKTKDLILVSRQLGSMIRAGVPILEAVRSLRKQVDKPSLQKVLDAVAYDIEGGESLSNALAKHPQAFSLFYLGVVKTGEASGRLSDSLTILADYLEQNYSFSRKVRSALMYPAFVLAAVIIIVIIMFSFVVPQLVALFEEANVLLPLPTRILIGLTDFGRDFWYVIVLLAVALAIMIRSYLRTPEGQYTASSWLLHLPIVSQLARKLYLSRLTSILYTLFSSDVPVIEALRIARSSVGNKVYQRVLRDTAEAVKNGSSMSAVWEQEPFIPPMLTTMVGVGERSGEIEKAFAEAHRFFRRDVDEILTSVTVFLEPVLVILLGIGVGFIVAAVLLPIYNLVLVI